ncbi:MAG: class I tRNA ligase family protein, partial [Acidobacteria bacterium]|nr:class I tRNA ligase family protein [Acidobacteriota bacterium]
CSHCGGTQFRPERDILDVWFDSGSSHLAVLGKHPGLPWPADLYIEGNDQYRGWFHSSLLVGVGLRGRSPYRQVATHGWVLDEQGRAMSKSLGNVIEPQAIIHSHGAEILRLWVASADFRDDIRISQDRLNRLSESYRKIRNTFRFCLANLYDFNPATDLVPLSQMTEVDQWALYRTSRMIELCRSWSQELGFHKVYHALYNFCTVELSAFYFDITKDRLYTAAPHSAARRSAQTALYRIADALVRLVAPILCFTADEVWSHLPERPPELPSVHLARFPEAAELAGDFTISQIERLGNWDRLIAVRNEVLKVLEAARKEKFIGNSLEAKVELSAEGEWERLLEEYQEILPMLFIVSQAHLSKDGLLGASEGLIRGLRIAVRRAEGQKCERCWNYSVRVGENAELPGVCERCAAAIQAIESSSQ